MSTGPLDAPALRQLARAAAGRGPCADCSTLHCPGWDSVPPGFDLRRLRVLGTLRTGDDEPTWDEHHPQGTRLESPDAPVSPAHYPYNRSDVLACSGCGRAFLHYTEAGGYYSEPRLRELDAARIVG